MARLSGAAVLLIVVVPLVMYTCALLVGIQLGRALERSPDSTNIVSVGGVVQYFAKELLDTERHRGGRDFGEPRVLQSVPARSPPRVFGRPIEPKHIYSRPQSSNTPSRARSYNRNDTWVPRPRGVFSIVCPSCTVGGHGGRPFYMPGQNVSHLHSITLFYSSVIHSLACNYSIDGDEVNPVSAGPWGLPHSYGFIAARATINLSAGEHLTAVEGTDGKAPWNLPSTMITSLKFRTNLGKMYGPFGSESGFRFSIPATDGSCIVGFRGRSGWLIDAIGVYSRPSCSSNRTDSYPYLRDQNLVHDG